MIIGTTLGGLTSVLRLMQAKIGRLREEEMRRTKVEEAEHPSSDQAVSKDEDMDFGREGRRSWWNDIRVWVVGLGGEKA